MSTEQEILVTGIKVVDLLAPYAKGGKIGMLHWVLSSISEVVQGIVFSENVRVKCILTKKLDQMITVDTPIFKLE